MRVVEAMRRFTVDQKIAGVSVRIDEIDMSDGNIYFPKTAEHESIAQIAPEIIHAFTMGCREDDRCPLLPANAALAQDDVGDWGLDDPANPETDVQQVCEQALEHVVELISEIIALPSLKPDASHAHA